MTDTFWQLLRLRWIPIVLVTVLTLGLVAAVVLSTTSAGCSLGVRNCLHAGGVAARSSSTSSTTPAIPGQPPSTSGASANPPDDSGPSSYPPYDGGGSAYPPYNAGGSAYPPYNPGGSAYPPYTPTVSSYPPVPNAGSGTSYPGGYPDCRLRLYLPGSGGFVVFPGGTFIADPKSAVTAPGTGQSFGLTYDAAYSKWLPVPPSWVSPDGTRYAYAMGGSIFVVDVSSGALTQLGAGRQFKVLSVQPDGVYVTSSYSPGLWRLSYTDTSVQTQLWPSLYWQGVSHGSAYGTAQPGRQGNTIVRLIVATGVTTNLFTLPGGSAAVLGFDSAGSALIQWSSPEGTAIFGANNEELAYSPSGWGATPQGAPIADQTYGIWFPTSGGIALYTLGNWYAVSDRSGQLAGPCF